jgi:hypothetical protein
VRWERGDAEEVWRRKAKCEGGRIRAVANHISPRKSTASEWKKHCRWRANRPFKQVLAYKMPKDAAMLAESRLDSHPQYHPRRAPPCLQQTFSCTHFPRLSPSDARFFSGCARQTNHQRVFIICESTSPSSRPRHWQHIVRNKMGEMRGILRHLKVIVASPMTKRSMITSS